MAPTTSAGRPRPARERATGLGAAPTGPDGIETPGRRRLLLDALRAAPQPRSILSLAEELGIHANTVRFHLEALLESGQVEQSLADTTRPGRPPVLFRATHRMDRNGPTNYRLLASMLTSHLAASTPNPAAASTELGRTWASQLLGPATKDRRGSSRMTRGEVLARMTRLLNDLGFAPEPPSGPRDRTIRLRHCPFLGLVAAPSSTDGLVADRPVTKDGYGEGGGYGEVVCSLHLGLMQGALSSMHSALTVDQLEPFVEPDLCVAHLAPAPAHSTTGSQGALSRSDAGAATADGFVMDKR